MRDRFDDIQEALGSEERLIQPPPPPPTKKTSSKKSQHAVFIDINIQPQSSDDTLKTFFTQISDTRDLIGLVKNNIDKLQVVHESALVVVSQDESDQKADELECLINKTNILSKEIRNTIRKIDNENKILSKDPQFSNSQLRIRHHQHAALAKKFIDMMSEYKAMQKRYQDKYKLRLQRQILVVKPTATQEEITEILNDPSPTIFSMHQQLPSQHGLKLEAQRALSDIETRHREIVVIEKSIVELQQMFMDMASMIAAQGEVIDKIDGVVCSAMNDTENGITAIERANKLQRKSRKKMIWMVALLVILSGAIAIGVAMAKKGV